MMRKSLRNIGLSAVVLAASILSGCASTQPASLQLSISTGKLNGQALGASNDVIAYKHIPYAKPPVGPLRWAPPQPPESWSGSLEEKNDPPACMQQITSSTPSSIKALSQSEDCLYLNVFTPTTALNDARSGDTKKPLPVLFLIHGGGRTRSALTRIRADITELNRQGIVVVTPQYRLGIFSFLAHPELSAESPHNVSGNYGMQDLVAALKWVQSNIGSFGGDPSSVTIMGPSGGGTATGMLLATPLTKGLFHRAAPMCSNAGIGRMHRLNQTHLDQPSAEDLGVRFAKGLNVKSLAALRAIPAEQLQQQVLASGVNSYDPPSGAGDIVDGWMFPRPVIDLHKTGARNDVPVMLGFNADEVSLFGNAGLIDGVPASASDYEKSIKIRYGELSSRYLRQYPAAKPINAIYNVARDRAVSYGSESLARFSHKVSAPTYLYYMAHRPADANQPVKGTSRNRDISHCAGYKFFTGWYPKQGATQADHKLAKTMATYLVNFIKTGNPNQAGLGTWQPYNLSGKSYMRFESGEAQPSTNLLPGMWELHDNIRLRDEKQGKFRHWLGGWASQNLLRKNRLDVE